LRISVKGRYAVASMITIAENFGRNEFEAVINISEKLGISKIYLEQVFTLLKKAELVRSVKGPQGGYILTRHPSKITAYDILNATEASLFEATENTVEKTAPEIDTAMKEIIFDGLDNVVAQKLKSITLEQLSQKAKKNKKGQDFMFYI
jgi:Rrf2 family protein